MNQRFVRNAVMLALPSVALCAAGIYFLMREAPKIVRTQKAEITREYRVTAEALVTNRNGAVLMDVREKGWRQVSKIDRKFPWGFVPRGPGRVFVWIEDPEKRVHGREVAEIVDRTALWLYGGVSAVLAISLGMSLFGILQMYRHDRARDEFLAATVHDLRTPLVALRGAVKRTVKQLGDGTSGLEDAERTAEHLLRIIRNAADFLKLGGKRRPPETAVFDLVAEIRETYALFSEEFAEEKSGPVSFSLPPTLPVVADPTLARQILWNLFANEAKYAAPHGRIAVEARLPSAGPAVVEFVDNGPGMTPRQLRRAFDRYYRASGLHACGKGGFGIGLSISREFARAMGGNLSVRANTPRGCIFRWEVKRG